MKQALAYSINCPGAIIGQCKECSIDDLNDICYRAYITIMLIPFFSMKVYYSKYNTL